MTIFKKITCLGCAFVLLLASYLQAGPSPLVNVTVSPSVVDREALQPATFTLHLSTPAPHDLGIVFYMSGNARLGFDYTLSGTFGNSGQIVIPAGQSSATVTLTPRRLDARFLRENAMMNLVHDTQNIHTYSLGVPTRANVVIEIE